MPSWNFVKVSLPCRWQVHNLNGWSLLSWKTTSFNIFILFQVSSFRLEDGRWKGSSTIWEIFHPRTSNSQPKVKRCRRFTYKKNVSDGEMVSGVLCNVHFSRFMMFIFTHVSMYFVVSTFCYVKWDELDLASFTDPAAYFCKFKL